MTGLLVRAEKRTESYDSRIAVLEQTIVQCRTDTEKLRDSLRSATDKLTALSECTVAVQTGTGTQTELTPELTPELTQRTAYTGCTDCTDCTDSKDNADRQTVQTTKAKEPRRKDLVRKTKKTVREVDKKRRKLEWHRGYA